jgi:hypothetical protein
MIPATIQTGKNLKHRRVFHYNDDSKREGCEQSDLSFPLELAQYRDLLAHGAFFDLRTAERIRAIHSAA